MPKRGTATVAVQPAQGHKITFGDGSDDEDGNDGEQAAAGPSRPTRRAPHVVEPTSDSEGDGDDAPEAVGMTAGKRMEERQAAEEDSASRARKQAAAARSRTIAAQKEERKEALLASDGRRRKQATKNSVSEGGRRSDRHNGSSKRISVSDHQDELNPGNAHGDDDEQDSEARRLRQRMEAAMAEAAEESGSEGESGEGRASGTGEDDEDEDADESDDDLSQQSSDEEMLESDEDAVDDDEMRSFHTNSEEDGSDGDGDGSGSGSDADSETLEDGPLDDKTRLLRAKMQEMMEAAERRAGMPASAPKARSKGKQGPKHVEAGVAAVGDGDALRTSSTNQAPAKAARLAPSPADDPAQLVFEETYDLQPGMPQPLSARAIEAAERAREERLEKERRAREAEEARRREGEGRKRKRKRRVEKQVVSKKAGDIRLAPCPMGADGSSTTLRLLPPALDVSPNSLPPVFAPGQRVAGGQNSRKVFMKAAMRRSGQMPGAGIGNGRR